MSDDTLALTLSILKKLLKKNNQSERGSLREGQMKLFLSSPSLPKSYVWLCFKTGWKMSDMQIASPGTRSKKSRAAAKGGAETEAEHLQHCESSTAPRTLPAPSTPTCPVPPASSISHCWRRWVLVPYFSFWSHSSFLGQESTPLLEGVLLSWIREHPPPTWLSGKALNSLRTLLGEKPLSSWLPLLQQKLLLDWGTI